MILKIEEVNWYPMSLNLLIELHLGLLQNKSQKKAQKERKLFSDKKSSKKYTKGMHHKNDGLVKYFQ